MKGKQLRLRLSSWYQQVRGSLFYVPAGYVALAAGLAWTTNRIDERLGSDLPDIPLLLPATVDSARSLLSTIAGATITVAGVVFSLTVIAAQLTSTQYSPRVLRGLLRDRLSQNVIGVVVATFTYCLLILAVTRGPGGGNDEAEVLQSVSLSLAMALAVVAVLGIIAFLDHSARTMQVGEIVRRVSEETHGVILARTTAPGEDGTPRDDRRRDEVEGLIPERDPDLVVDAPREGWVQQIDDELVLASVPEGATVRLETRPGRYLIEGRPIASLWCGEPDRESIVADIHRAFAIGDERTMQQDVMFGVRQLVDIALRAMSTGINDPTTAIETLYRLGSITRELQMRELAPLVVEGADGRCLVCADRLRRADVVRYAFRQIRVASIDQPGVISVLVLVLGQVAEELREHGLEERVGPLDDEVRLTLRALERHGHLEEDVAPVRAYARRFDLGGADD